MLRHGGTESYDTVAFGWMHRLPTIYILHFVCTHAYGRRGGGARELALFRERAFLLRVNPPAPVATELLGRLLYHQQSVEGIVSRIRAHDYPSIGSYPPRTRRRHDQQRGVRRIHHQDREASDLPSHITFLPPCSPKSRRPSYQRISSCLLEAYRL